MLDNDKHDLLDDHRKEHSWMKVHQNTRSSFRYEVIGNLRTTTKFTTSTSVDWEKTATRTSVSAGKRKVKMHSVGRSTMTTLNVNTDVKL